MLLDRELDIERLVNRVGALTGIADREQIERAVEATLEVLAEQELAHEFDATRFYSEISDREGTSLGFAMEHAQVVLQVIAEMLGEEDRRRLVRHLPEEMEALIRPPVRERAVPPRGHPGRGQTLATAQPGSQHPVSSAAPDRAHAHSVARTAEPHADTQVATSHGLNEGRSLADGEPGSDRALIDRRSD